MGLVNPSQGEHPAQRPADRRHGGAQARPARDRLRAGGPAYLPAAHGDGKSAHRARPPRRHRRQEESAARQGVHVLPGAGRAAQPGRRHAVGRRAADAGDRARHDARAQDHPARRADRRPDAAHGVADQQHHRRAAQGRRRHSAGRAERAADAGSQPARLHHGEGRRCAITAPRPRSMCTTRSSSSISGCSDGRSCSFLPDPFPGIRS